MLHLAPPGQLAASYNQALRIPTDYSAGERLHGVSGALNMVHDVRAPGIIEQAFDPSQAMVWPTSDSNYQRAGQPIFEYYRQPTNLVTPAAKNRAAYWNRVAQDDINEPSVSSFFGRPLAPFSVQWTGLDLGRLKQQSGLAWRQYQPPVGRSTGYVDTRGLYA